MGDLDIKPDQYRFRGADGRMHRRDDKRYLLVGLVMCLVILGYTFVVREEVEATTLFAVVLGIGVAAGIFIGNLLKDVY
jgi:hypothetical protein